MAGIRDHYGLNSKHIPRGKGGAGWPLIKTMTSCRGRIYYSLRGFWYKDIPAWPSNVIRCVELLRSGKCSVITVFPPYRIGRLVSIASLLVCRLNIGVLR